MTTEARDELIDQLLEGSDDMLDDEDVKPRLRLIKGRPNEEIKDELLGIIDDIVYADLASVFVLRVLHIMWRNVGGTEEELAERNRLLGDRENIEKMRPRFKWVTH